VRCRFKASLITRNNNLSYRYFWFLQQFRSPKFLFLLKPTFCNLVNSRTPKMSNLITLKCRNNQAVSKVRAVCHPVTWKIFALSLKSQPNENFQYKNVLLFLDLSVVYDHVINYSDANHLRTVKELLSDNWDRLCETLSIPLSKYLPVIYMGEQTTIKCMPVKMSSSRFNRNGHTEVKSPSRPSFQEIHFPLTEHL
jgi:hypothetical protein